MKLGYGLQLRQTQKLVMTAELRQALEVLQRPVLELRQLIEAELLQNPTLEQDGEADSAAADEAEWGAVDAPAATADPDGLADGELGAADWLDYFHDGRDVGLVPRPNREDRDRLDLEALATRAPTLSEHLLFQLHTAGLPREDRRIGEYLIGNLDDNGLLRIPLAEIAAQLGVGEDAVERVLRILQGFDPPGVAARSLRECLQIQWAGLGHPNPLVPRIIEAHLEDLAAGRAQRIAAALGVTPAEVQEAADLIRTLDPKPGRRFGHPQDARYVIPDVTVERVGTDFVIIVNDAPLPRLTINPHYRRLLRSADGATRKYLQGKMQAALWFVRAVEQRRLTLYRVTEAILAEQRQFFERGVRHLRPLTLRQVAERLGIHESTVSRATSGKYAQTPHGVFELRYFFGSGIVAPAGAALSAESIKRRIGDLVAAEDKRRPLSDQAIADALERSGVPVSRRTVAKYREEMGVLPSSLRRRFA